MKYSLSIITILIFSGFVFAQNLNTSDFTEKEIEGGSVFKKEKNGKLDSIIVTMAAVNYGNALLFSKTNNQIHITNAADKNSLITIEIKNKKQVRTFLYKDKPAIIIENIDFDIQNLPKNKLISSSFSNNKINSNTILTNYKIFGDDMPDKTFKLFYGLNIRPDLDSLDSIFKNIGDFFSEEDSLLKIFYGRYAEKFAPQVLAYLETDNFGKIKDGIVLDFKNNVDEKVKYEIYQDGKVMKSGTENLANFQTVFIKYREKAVINK